MKFEFDFKSIIVLVVIVVVSTFFLGYTNLITEDIIKEKQIEKLDNQLLILFEDMDSFRILSFDQNLNLGYGSLFSEGVYYEILNSRDDVIGYVVPVEAMGYNDNIKVLVAFDRKKQKIINVSILNQLETPGIGTKIITEKSFLRQFEDVNVNEVNYQTIDGITGATVSSSAVIRAVEKAIENVKD
jgi:Na+-translocating ferredoxin:NAD+ oxidoreductase subunit G